MTLPCFLTMVPENLWAKEKPLCLLSAIICGVFEYFVQRSLSEIAQGLLQVWLPTIFTYIALILSFVKHENYKTNKNLCIDFMYWWLLTTLLFGVMPFLFEALHPIFNLDVGKFYLKPLYAALFGGVYIPVTWLNLSNLCTLHRNHWECTSD